ncbi:MAG: DUF72 domain-containing protein [Tenericutes bacterium]|nr:DUF72 domain-containing protein [Mycoplasmatota bacterium]MBI9009664.1 DUF72 domain-containing protein [Mycoplasmatota bacterium]
MNNFFLLKKTIMKTFQPKLYIGTSGWSYKDWVPGFYPKQQCADLNWLQFYSQYFNTIEVNSTFYTYMNPKVIDVWISNTRHVDDFIFTIKLHSDFTHKRQYTSEQVKAVRFNLDMLAREERLGGILMQFPYSFDCTDANVEHVRKLAGEFAEYNKFLEVRHKSWHNKNAHSLTICTIDQPLIGEAIEFKPKAGNEIAYIRFHGRNEEAWKRSINSYGEKQLYEQQSERYKYFYSPGELSEIERGIIEVYDKVKQVFVIMNNHPTGYAVANAFELMHMLKGKYKVSMPDTIVKAFPRLKSISA